MRFWTIALIMTFAAGAEARVFALDKQKLAFYLKGNFGSSRMERDAFDRSDGATANIKESVDFQYAGELGLFFKASSFGVRLGVQVINPQKLDNVEGKNAAGILEYNLTSRVFGVMPVGHLEFDFVSGPQFRWYLSAGGGVGSVTLLNTYTFAPASPYGLVDFTEEGTAWVPMYEGSTGIEFSLVDNATMLFDIGYRHLQVTGLKHTRSATTFLGPVGKGSKMTNVGGGERELDMNSVYAGLGFKFYFQ